MSVDIRDYTRADRDGVVDAMVRSTLFERDDAPFLEGVLDRHSDEPGASRCLVASSEGRVVGAVLARSEEAADRVWDLTMIGVRADLQNRGVGRELMAAMESDLIGSDARLVLVRTSGTERFAPTRAFYERLGYDQVAHIDDYWTDGDDLVILRRGMRRH